MANTFYLSEQSLSNFSTGFFITLIKYWNIYAHLIVQRDWYFKPNPKHNGVKIIGIPKLTHAIQANYMLQQFSKKHRKELWGQQNVAKADS